MKYFLEDGGSPIDWSERFGSRGESPQVSLEVDRSTATRVVDVAWGERWQFATAVVGSARLGVARDGKAAIIRIAPWRFPRPAFGSGLGWLWATKVSFRGVGTPTLGDQECVEGANNEAEAKYELARCTIVYETRSYDILSDEEHYVRHGQSLDEASLARYVTRTVRPQGEFLSLDGGAFHYAGLTNAKGESPTVKRGLNKTIVAYNLSLTWHLVPYEAIPSKFYNTTGPNFALDRCLGCVNNKPFAGLPAGTLMLGAAEIRPAASPLGQRVADVTYFLKFFNPSDTVRGHTIHQNYVAGHQHIYTPKPPASGEAGWYEVVTDDALAASSTAPTNFIAQTDEVSIFNWRDFDNLFRPATYS